MFRLQGLAGRGGWLRWAAAAVAVVVTVAGMGGSSLVAGEGVGPDGDRPLRSDDRHPEDQFRRFDRNQDGQLDAAERAAMQQAGIAPPGMEKADSPRGAAPESKPAEEITANTLPKIVQKARADMQALAKLPADLPSAKLKDLRTKAISMALKPETCGAWEVVARGGDVARVGGSGYALAELTRKGGIYLNYPFGRMYLEAATSKRGPGEAVFKASQGVSSTDMSTEDDMQQMLEAAHKQGKLFMAFPSTEMLNAWGEEKLGAKCQPFDLVVLPLGDWAAVDPSKDKSLTVERIATASAAIRKANARCRIFLDVGRGPDVVNAPKTAAGWIDLLSKIAAKDPKLFDGIHLGGQAKERPGDSSIAPTLQALAWLRLSH